MKLVKGLNKRQVKRVVTLKLVAWQEILIEILMLSNEHFAKVLNQVSNSEDLTL